MNFDVGGAAPASAARSHFWPWSPRPPGQVGGYLPCRVVPRLRRRPLHTGASLPVDAGQFIK